MDEYVKSRIEEIEHQIELIKIYYGAKSEMCKPFLLVDNTKQNILKFEEKKSENQN